MHCKLFIFALLISNFITIRAVAQNQPSGIPDSSEVQAFFMNILTECQTNDEMSGAWVYSWESDATDRNLWIAKVIVNASNRDKQLAKFKTFFANTPKNLKARVSDEVVTLNLGSLVNSIQAELQGKLSDQGTLVNYAYLGSNVELSAISSFENFAQDLLPNLSTIRISVGGRIRSKEQMELVNDVLDAQLNAFAKETEKQTQSISFRSENLFKTVSASPTLSAYIKRIKKKMTQLRVLNGLLFEIFAVKDRSGADLRYEMYLYYDSDKEAEQQVAMKELLATIEQPLPTTTASSQSLPFSQLARQVNMTIQQCPKLDGCLVRRITFEIQGYLDGASNDISYQVVAKIRGNSQAEQQREDFQQVFENVLSLNERWHQFESRFVRITPDLSGIVPTSFSNSEKTRAYAYAVTSLRLAVRNTEHAKQYARCKQPEAAEQARARAGQLFIEAELAFMEAIVAAPERLELRYLRVISLIAAGREVHARYHMDSIVARGQTLREYAQSCEGLEFYQGDLRQQMISLERDAYFEQVYTHLGTPRR
jgi:hypothetical protein